MNKLARTSFANAPLANRKLSSPALVLERQSIPRLPADSLVGAAALVSGVVLLGEGIVSLFAGENQDAWSTIFRLFRIGVGGGLTLWVAASTY